MADLSITAANVAKGAAAAVSIGTAGETITAGQALYVKGSDGKLYKAQCDGTAEEGTFAGIALHGSLAGQPISYQTAGSITIGATVAVGTLYVLSATAGAICPVADLVSTNRVVEIGFGASATLLALSPIITGVAVP